MANKVYKRDDGSYLFYCIGCKGHHSFAVEKPFDNGAQWAFNGDLEKPTFSPSLLCNPGSNNICHSFVRNGKIEYLTDSYHELKGQTVEIPDFDTTYGNAE